MRRTLIMALIALGLSGVMSSAQARLVLHCGSDGQAYLTYTFPGGGTVYATAGGCAFGPWEEPITSWRTTGNLPETDWHHGKQAAQVYEVLSNIRSLTWTKIEPGGANRKAPSWGTFTIRKEHLPPAVADDLWRHMQ
jgi:hypothetical protein